MHKVDQTVDRSFVSAYAQTYYPEVTTRAASSSFNPYRRPIEPQTINSAIAGRLINKVQTLTFPERNFLNRQGTARLGFAVATPVDVITSAADAVVGTCAAVATIATLGCNKKIFKFAQRELCSGGNILANAYQGILRTLNPKAKFASGLENQSAGLLTQYFQANLQSLVEPCLFSKSLLVRQIAPRVVYLCIALCSILTRLADFVIGGVAVGLSTLALGRSKTLNSLAYSGLKLPALAADLFICLIKVINPYAGISRLRSTYAEI